MNTCKTCRWWGLHESDGPQKGCYCPKLESKDSDGARCDDPGATLMTGPDFGCIHHEDLPEVTEAAKAIADEFDKAYWNAFGKFVRPGLISEASKP